MGLFKKPTKEEEHRRREELAKSVFPMYKDIKVFYIGDQGFLTITSYGVWLFTYYNNNWHHNLYPYGDIVNYTVQYCPQGNTWKNVVFTVNVGNQTIETTARIKANEQDIIVDLINEGIKIWTEDDDDEVSMHGDDEGTDFSWDDLEALKGMYLVNVLPIIDDDGETLLGVSFCYDSEPRVNATDNEASVLHFFDGTIKLFHK